MLYYPYITMFFAYKSVIVSPCACNLFVSKVTKITRYMDVRFWRSFFGAFSVCDDCILKSTTAWLLKLSVLYIHSFMQVHNTTFQIKTVFNNVLFSTEVHNPLHAHLLALSHIYIYTDLKVSDWMFVSKCIHYALLCKWSLGNSCINFVCGLWLFQRPVAPALQSCKDLVNSVCKDLEPWQIILYTCGTTVAVLTLRDFLIHDDESEKLDSHQPSTSSPIPLQHALAGSVVYALSLGYTALNLTHPFWLSCGVEV